MRRLLRKPSGKKHGAQIALASLVSFGWLFIRLRFLFKYVFVKFTRDTLDFRRSHFDENKDSILSE